VAHQSPRIMLGLPQRHETVFLALTALGQGNVGMLYHIKFDTDNQALGFGEQRQAVAAAELERALAAQQAGRLLGFWVRADLGGVIFVLDADSHQALMAEIRSLPIFPFLRSIEVSPVVPHPQLPAYGAAKPDAEPAVERASPRQRPAS